LEKNWKVYGQTDFARNIIKTRTTPIQWPDYVRWDVYNVCEMAYIYNWQLME
jgi:hypothetical protein